MLFGVGIWMFAGGTHAGEFFAGYITEYSLSVDNLFIFLVIMSAFKVPAIHQHKVLLVGIVLALVLRGIFIAVGAAAISQFSWVFYVFGAFLVYTAVKLSRSNLGGEDDEEYEENRVTKWARKLFPVTDDYHGGKVFTRIDGKRFATPLFIVMIAIGSADLMFAVDSIPAIFGLTKEPFLVFAANAFALMGLRQLYFLLGGLLQAAGLPVDRAGGHPGLHRRQDGPRGPAHQHVAVPQRRPAAQRADREHRAVPDGDRGRAGDHRGGEPAEDPSRRPPRGDVGSRRGSARPAGDVEAT